MAKPSGRAAVWVAVAVAAGVLLRWYFVHFWPQLQGDPQVYAEIARNWFTRGVYGFDEQTWVRPTLIRLPGYPLFLGLCFRVFGQGNFQAVLWLQAGLDLVTCGLTGLLAKRLAGERAGLIAFALAAICPFTAAYSAAGLTETLTLLCLVLTFVSLQRWIDGETRWLWPLAGAMAYGMLLRPDQVLVPFAVLPVMLFAKGRAGVRRNLGSTAVVALLVVLPLIPWTVRNYRTFHVFQPLAPRYANDPGKPNPDGFQRWYRTWAVDYASTEDIYWNYDGERMDLKTLPSRAFDSPEQYRQTAAAFDYYNRTGLQSSQADAMFSALAEQRVKAHPVAYYIGLPIARLANMLLRPRVESLPGPLRWWRWNESSPLAYGRSIIFGVLNLVLIGLGIAGAYRLRSRRELYPLLAVFAAYFILRCALLMTVDNSEPRYTIEFVPIWIVLVSTRLATGA